MPVVKEASTEFFNTVTTWQASIVWNCWLHYNLSGE